MSLVFQVSGAGDFVDAAFDFLSGEGRSFDEYHLEPPQVEYDLSYDVETDSATFAIYDRWNGVKDVYFYGDNGHGHFEVPLDNLDFSTSGQFNGPGVFVDLEMF